MSISILYFAATRDAVGKVGEELELGAESLSVQELGQLLLERHPGLTLAGVRFAINEEFASSDQRVVPGDTVAVIPPVSGG